MNRREGLRIEPVQKPNARVACGRRSQRCDLRPYCSRISSARGRLTVVDATNVTREARRRLIGMARSLYVDAVAIAFDLPVETCVDRSASREGRPVEASVVRSQHEEMQRALRSLSGEGFRRVVTLRSDA